MSVWRCTVCGYLHKGDKPPAECPQCSSPSGEFSRKKEGGRLRFDGIGFDVLLINGSSHRSHNTSVLADLAEKELRKRKVRYRRYNLNELDVEHCWCCYSVSDSACTYPCRNQLDDVAALHEMLLQAKAVIITSPINWNNMSARLKDFLDRLTSLQNACLLGKKSMTAGKVLGILVNGHEDGGIKTGMDIFLYFQQMGCILAPFGFAYRTRGAGHNTKEDNAFFQSDGKLKKDVSGVVGNVVAMMDVGLEKRLAGKLSCVSE